HHGQTNETNLALACYHCNSAKGPNIAGIDPISGIVSPLYHPRHDAWHEHFERHGAWLFGRTPQGRATIQVLGINEPDAVSLRESLIEEGHAFDRSSRGG